MKLSVWTHIKLNYDNANGIYDEINKLSTELTDINDELTKLLVSLCAISASITLYYLAMLLDELINAYIYRSVITKDGLIILFAIMFIVSLGILISTVISLGNKNSEINNNLGTIKKDSKECQFSINLKNDYSYLQKDYEEFLKLGNEDQNLHSYLDDYSEGLIIAGLVVASVLAIYMLVEITSNTIEILKIKKILNRQIAGFATLIASAIFTVLIFCITTW